MPTMTSSKLFSIHFLPQKTYLLPPSTENDGRNSSEMGIKVLFPASKCYRQTQVFSLLRVWKVYETEATSMEN